MASLYRRSSRYVCAILAKHMVADPSMAIRNYDSQLETWNAQTIVNLSREDAISDLEELMGQIFTKRAEAVPAIPYVPFILSFTTSIKILCCVYWGRCRGLCRPI